MKTVTLLRHGQPVGGRLYRGNQDDPLTDLGWHQMSKAVNGKLWDLIISSPLLRCSEFAKNLAREQNILCQLKDDLVELGFGVWQGKSPDEIGLAKVKAFKNNPRQNKPQGAEDLAQFQQRVLSVYNQIKKQPEQRILLIAHAGVIRVIKAYLDKIDLDDIFQVEVPLAICEEVTI